MGHLNGAPHNIIIFRALQLGDMLCTVPAFRALRTAFPAARISLVGLPWAEDFTRRFARYLDAFIPFPGWPGLPEQSPAVEKIPTFLKSIHDQQFDLALQMQGSGGISNALVALFGARQAAGFYLPGQFQPDPALFRPYPQGEHEIRVFLRLMEHLGIPSQGEALEFPLSEDERRSFQSFKDAHRLAAGSYACLHPGARFIGRRWPLEKFARVGDGLHQMGLQVVVTGAESERELAQAVTSKMEAPALNAAGLTSLGDLAQLLAGARILICNDTGVSHLAAAYQTPSVILFTVSDPRRWQPLDSDRHRAVQNADKVSPEDVLAEAISLLREVKVYAS